MHRSDRYICILVGALCLTGTSAFYTRGLGDDRLHAAFPIHVLSSATLYAASLVSLSFAAEEDARLKAKIANARQHKGGRASLRPYQYWALELATLSTRVTGLLGGAYTIALPLLSSFEDPMADVALRIPTFFYGFKLLDLTVARARSPPVPVEGYGLTGWRAHVKYAWRLLTETRYASFNIAVDESARKTASAQKAGAIWTLAPWLALPLAYLFPAAAAEAQVIGGLLGIQLGLEGLHCIFHPRCPNWLFCQPFTSTGLLEFWTCRWHQGAQPFLYNLGYVPARAVAALFFGPASHAARAAGVLGAFSLSGVWHGWSGAPLVKPEYAWRVGTGLWFLFILQGLGCIAEKKLRASGRDRWRTGWQGRLFTAICWACSVESASVWLRYALRKSSLPRLGPQDIS